MRRLGSLYSLLLGVPIALIAISIILIIIDAILPQTVRSDSEF